MHTVQSAWVRAFLTHVRQHLGGPGRMISLTATRTFNINVPLALKTCKFITPSGGDCSQHG